MPAKGVRVTVKGPLLEGQAPFIVQETIRDCVQAMVAEGERQVKLQLYSGHGVQSGHYRRSVHGEVSGSMHGRIHDSQVVYGPWLEGVSSRNQETRFKGYAMFRNAKQQLERLKMAIIRNNLANLLRRLG